MSILSFSTVGQEFPADTVAGNYLVTILNTLGTVVNSQETALTTATFTVAAGVYTASVQLLDENGTPLGEAAHSAQFTVAAGPVTITIQVPLTVSVTP